MKPTNKSMAILMPPIKRVRSQLEEVLDSKRVRTEKKSVFHDPLPKKRLSKPELVELLLSMPIVCGRKPLADLFAEKGKQKLVKKDTEFLKQGEEGDVFYLILSGRVSISVNSRIVAYRTENDFVGENGLLGPCKRRKATVKTVEDSRLLVLHRSDISKKLETNACVFKQIASTLSDRLDERRRFLRPPNQRPELFIGSSSEQVKNGFLKRLVDSKRLRKAAKLKPWTQAFPLTSGTLDALLDAVASVDFALLVLSPDDKVKKKHMTKMAPRDNVLFELGLFLGVLGKERTILLVEEGFDVSELDLPTDLAGITYLPYKKGAKGEKSFSNAIARVVERIKSKWIR